MKKMFSRKKIFYFFSGLILVLLGGYMLPERFTLPVEDMNNKSFNHRSFWYYPWGASVRHKGVDIFAPKGKGVYAACSGIVICAGTHKRGGNMVLILGPKWRIHHYLHLDTVLAANYSFVHRGNIIGKVGNSGNATGKPCHLHYAISTIFPYVWQADSGIQGNKRMWYIDPTPYLLHQSKS